MTANFKKYTKKDKPRMTHDELMKELKAKLYDTPPIEEVKRKFSFNKYEIKKAIVL